MTAEGTFPKSDGDILYASEVNKFNSTGWNDLIHISIADKTYVGILTHSATAWTAYDAGGINTMITSDAGVNWTAASADIADMTGVGKISNGDNTKAIICDHNSGNVSISSDSGDNWASASTDPAAITRVLDLSFPTATVAVVGCDQGAAARGIFFSADAGDTWTICTAGPAADVPVIDMFDGSDGMAIDTAGNIWTTSDGGDNWSDTTYNIVLDPPTTSSSPSVIALTSTTGIFLTAGGRLSVQTFSTSSQNSIGRLVIPDGGETGTFFSNLVKITNGNVYFVQYTFDSDGLTSCIMTLYKSEDNGVTWSQRALGVSQMDANTSLSTYGTHAQLTEYDTNKLLLLSGIQQLIKIDEEY